MFVYTFWEPREAIPYYLQLCMETWKKNLPNATIVVLDYKNIGELLDVRELGLNLFSGKLSLMLIADAIRVELLAKHGGVWLDLDTLVLSLDAEKYFLPDEKHRTVFFGNPKTKSPRICFINTPPGAVCMNLWRESVREKIWNLNAATSVKWDFLGNTFIDDYAKKFPDEIKIIDKNIVMPDSIPNADIDTQMRAYCDFYFGSSLHLTDINADMLLLHNSWTLPFFLQLPREEFFNFDCTMVNVLAEALEIKLPPARDRFHIQIE